MSTPLENEEVLQWEHPLINIFAQSRGSFDTPSIQCNAVLDALYEDSTVHEAIRTGQQFEETLSICRAGTEAKTQER
jgi:hypothetical protein